MNQIQKQCPRCNKDFKTERWTKIYCSEKCARNALKARRERRQRVQERQTWYTGKRKCIECGEMFEPRDRKHKCCKKECSIKYNISHCGSAYIRYKTEWQAIIITKGMDKCWKCGYNKHLGAIDFHHINNDRQGKKKECIATVITYKPTPERIKKLEGCIPLCATCHRELHIEERTVGKPTKLKKILI